LLREECMSARPGTESFDELVTTTLPSVRVELPLLRHALELCGGNQLKAAKLLGINRNTLRKRLRLLGLLPVAGPNGAKAGARSA
jgi:DNA-binding NtrC family response regulator